MSSQLLAYFGHHKCATQWVKGIVRGVCRQTCLEFTAYTGSSQFDHDLGRAVEANGTEFLCYLNARPRHVAMLLDYRGFHMVRDPRDIAVSAYFSHLYSHPTGPWLAEHRRRLESVDKDEGLLLELQRRRRQFESMLSWDYENPDVLEVRMEDVTSEPNRWFTRIFEFLGLLEEDDAPEDRPSGGISAATLRSLLEKNSFARKSRGREIGQEDVHSHYRKGASGDWVNHFSAAHVEYFKQHYNELLLRLGYESRADW
jgi:Sulfotransferase domain